ncbi:MAG TPA: flagellar biosynthesis protein FliQ [Pirellulales bacterium]|jgi:flagellar biosynthetic protein FliQ|nr:flagellar biosynthesis protein FliQ [Pirellulales bacterium]
MDTHDVVDVGREALAMAMLLSTPMLVTGLVIGLVVGLIQALTQIQEQSIALVPRLVGVLVAFSLTLPWAIAQLQQYVHDLFTQIPQRL